MSKSKLHQKTRLGFLPLVLSFCVCVCTCSKQTRDPSPIIFPKIKIPSGSLGSFRVETSETHILLFGFFDPKGGNTIPLLFDTGSDSSFLAEEIYPTPKILTWQDRSLSFSVRKGILPEGVQGILGHDFFQHTCIWWEGDRLTVFEASSAVCSSPEAYFSTELKLLVTEKKDSFYYVRNLRKGKTFWSLVDTGSSLSFLPSEYEAEAESQGNRRVFLAGGQIRDVALFYTKGPLDFETRQGITISYFDFSFFRGISLEHLQLSREKDSEAVWVIGLNLLCRNPLFWDFERNHIGMYSRTQNIN
jgi:hypothetical protein